MTLGKIHLLFAAFLLPVVFAHAQQSREAPPNVKISQTFTNPLWKGADPWIIKYNGMYYTCKSIGSGIEVSESRFLTRKERTRVVWYTPNEGWNRSFVWAPELHCINGKWYIYYAAGINSKKPYIWQRTGVLACDTPLGNFKDMGQLYTGDDPQQKKDNIWGIDMTVFTHHGKFYAVWSGWPEHEQNSRTDAVQQNLYIAPMPTPTTIGKRILLSEPDQPWQFGEHFALEEGPSVIKHDGNVFIIFSTRGSWTTHYRLGQLRLRNADADPLDPKSWIKSGPVFLGDEKRVFGVGHASFTTSPDDTEWWIYYHSKVDRIPGWNRVVRLQKFTFDADGNPFFGSAVLPGVPVARPSGEYEREMGLFEKKAFDTIVLGKPVSIYTLQNASGMTAQFTNYGARLVSLWVPSGDGSFKDVIWGYETIRDYFKATEKYSGPIVGRYGNRIGEGKFTLDGKAYQLSINNGKNHLHGGKKGWSTKIWDASEEIDDRGVPCIKMVYHSTDGEEGYPGNVEVETVYRLTDDNKLEISYQVITDAPTIVNPTSHIYFNLHGTSAFSTNSHILTIHADNFTPTDDGLIPTGEIRPVEGTPLDFRIPTPIGERIDAAYEPLLFGKGYDHNFVLNKPEPHLLTLAAKVYEPTTGIAMEVWTDQPGIQFYSGNFMDGKDEGKRGDRHNYRTGIALETQNFPDAPNHANFPTAVLRPGEVYRHTCVYAFSLE